MCGENQRFPQQVPPLPGSPPRVRGKLRDDAYSGSLPRITPACAGKTLLRRFQRHLFQDHPRVCGENELKGFICERDSGSPPRVRGKRVNLTTVT